MRENKIKWKRKSKIYNKRNHPKEIEKNINKSKMKKKRIDKRKIEKPNIYTVKFARTKRKEKEKKEWQQ